MAIEDKLKELILNKFGSMREFSKQIGMSQSTLATIFKRGVQNANVLNIIKICQALEISADALAQDKIEPVSINPINHFMTNEMDDIVKLYRMNIEEYASRTIGGMPMTMEDAELLLDTLEFSIELIKRKKLREKKDDN